MAKKAKKAAKKAPKKSTKPAKKPSKKAAPKKGAKTAANPSQVTTGGGATPRQVGDELVALFNAGKASEVEAKLWSPAIVSVEGESMCMAWSGKKAVDGKNQWWMSENTILSASADGPYVGASGFAVKFKMDIEAKKTGTRTHMEEVGVYTVSKGKIVREEFMYGKSEPQAAANN